MQTRGIPCRHIKIRYASFSAGLCKGVAAISAYTHPLHSSSNADSSRCTVDHVVAGRSSNTDSSQCTAKTGGSWTLKLVQGWQVVLVSFNLLIVIIQLNGSKRRAQYGRSDQAVLTSAVLMKKHYFFQQCIPFQKLQLLEPHRANYSPFDAAQKKCAHPLTCPASTKGCTLPGRTNYRVPGVEGIISAW